MHDLPSREVQAACQLEVPLVQIGGAVADGDRQREEENGADQQDFRQIAESEEDHQDRQEGDLGDGVEHVQKRGYQPFHSPAAGRQDPGGQGKDHGEDDAAEDPEQTGAEVQEYSAPGDFPDQRCQDDMRAGDDRRGKNDRQQRPKREDYRGALEKRKPRHAFSSPA